MQALNELQDKILNNINYYTSEFDIGYIEIIGLLELIKMSIYEDQFINEGEEEETEEEGTEHYED